MTEQPPTSPSEETVDPSAELVEEPMEAGEDTGPTSALPTLTGVPAVDDVLRDLDDLERLRLEEHLGRFEHAHASLRSALDADPSDPTEPGDPA
jgi:hypothetical protein